MSNPTAEKIKFERWRSRIFGTMDFTIYTDPKELAEKPIASKQGSGPEDEANAELIVAAWNAAREINEHDPIRAAEMMPRAIEALKRIANWEVSSISEAMTITRRAFLDVTDREGA